MAVQKNLASLDVGLDLTSDELRVCAIRRTGKDYVLERFGVGKISSSVFAAGKVSDQRELGSRIKDILAKNGMKGNKAMISLSGKASITRRIELPAMGAAQTRQAISLQIGQYVPFPPNDISYAYRNLPKGSNPNPSLQDVILTATRRSTILSLLDTLKFAGMKPGGIKVTSLSASNLLLRNIPKDYNQTVCFIDLRDSVTDMTFYLKGNFRLTRSIEIGYNTIINKISQALTIPVQQAEEYLRDNRMDLTLSEEEIDPTEDNRMREAVMSLFSNFVNELVRSIRYYESQAQRQDRVGKLFIFGNIQLFENLDKYLEEQSGLEVSKIALSSLVQIRQGVYSVEELNANAEKLIVAAGLCAELATGKIDLDLMPREFYKSKQVPAYAFVGLLLLAASVGFVYLKMDEQQKQIVSKQEVKRAKEAEKSKFVKDAAEFDTVKTKVQAELPKFKQLYSLVSQQIPWERIMVQLGQIIPDSIFIGKTAFSAKDKTVQIKGTAPNWPGYLQFLFTIDNEPYFYIAQIKHQRKDLTDNSGGGGGTMGGGGGGGASAGGGGSLSGRNPFNNMNILTPGRDYVDPDETDKPMQNYQLPDYGFSPGASIDKFFGPQHEDYTPYYIEFELTLKINSKIFEVGNPTGIEDKNPLKNYKDMESRVTNLLNK